MVWFRSTTIAEEVAGSNPALGTDAVGGAPTVELCQVYSLFIAGPAENQIKTHISAICFSAPYSQLSQQLLSHSLATFPLPHST